ncbi:MAG: glycosyltransferase [Candidatus Pacebacteria bacterium]|nr:glycosyltransferase [Candidatus Paceibacterota bacterium]
MLSIIIPTKNEEKYLPKLLDSIKIQSFSDYEIIVADNKSQDRTQEVARSFGAEVVQGGLPAEGRNRGAAVANGDIFLFLDADTEMPDINFLKDAFREFDKKKLSMGVPVAITEGNYLDRLFFRWWNYFVASSQFAKPLAGGWCIFVKRDIHQKLGGFDEKIILGEDSDYAQRGCKLGRFRFMSSVKIRVSSRRLKKEGYLKVLLQDVGQGIYLLTHGRMDKKNRFGYEFDIYEEGNKNK